MTQTSLYFNTTNLSSGELLSEHLSARSLQSKVLDFFESSPKNGFIWSEVCEGLGVEISQYGSVKRCMSNLLREGKLYKSTNVKKSIFGKKAHFYFFNPK